MKIAKWEIQGGRPLYIKLAFLVAYVGIAVFCFVGWRSHTVLIDYNKVEGLPEATDNIMVSIDGQDAEEYMAGDRTQAKLVGRHHSIHITWEKGDANPQKPFDHDFELPLKSDMYLISITKLLAGKADAVAPFTPEPEAPPANEEAPGAKTGGDPNAVVSPEGEAAPK